MSFVGGSRTLGAGSGDKAGIGAEDFASLCRSSVTAGGRDGNEAFRVCGVVG